MIFPSNRTVVSILKKGQERGQEPKPREPKKEVRNRKPESVPDPLSCPSPRKKAVA